MNYFLEIFTYFVMIVFICVPGTGEYASQHGMSMGAIRHATDIKTEDITRQSQGMLHAQTGM